ncbi:MAG: prepilin-type N-terminal cleavage/methylation domain-containing protein [Puniceicoccaceae bacterium]|nr:MAG: prepilin-type N-terminal cleavage/methylation domain-containing protein [Puniceicoccaceae bacterium]
MTGSGKTYLPAVRRSRAGLTLIEVLAAIAILALLAAIVAPGLRQARENAAASSSRSNLRQLVLANLAFAAEHGTYAPAQEPLNRIRWHGARTGPTAPFDPARGFLGPYLGRDGLVKTCPLLRHTLRGGASFEDGTGGYGYNAAYIGGSPGWPYRPARPDEVPLPSRTVMFATTAFPRAEGLQEYAYAEPPYWDFGYGASGVRPHPSVHFRFRGQALVGWCDGHVSAEQPSRIGGANPYGGDAAAAEIGWFGPAEDNGFWNPRSGR